MVIKSFPINQADVLWQCNHSKSTRNSDGFYDLKQNDVLYHATNFPIGK